LTKTNVPAARVARDRSATQTGGDKRVRESKRAEDKFLQRAKPGRGKSSRAST